MFAQYRAALDDFCAQCRDTPDQWHSLAKAFSALRLLLLPHAAAGDRDCQYSLGTMGLLGLCCESKAEWGTGLERALEDATHWWFLPPSKATRGRWTIWSLRVAVQRQTVCGLSSPR